MFIFLTILYSFYFLKQSALHWGAKHGNENVVKLIAGTYKGDVNLRTVSKRKTTTTFLNLSFVPTKVQLIFIRCTFIKMK